MFGKVANKTWFKKYATTAKTIEPATTRTGKIKKTYLEVKTESVSGTGAVKAIKRKFTERCHYWSKGKECCW